MRDSWENRLVWLWILAAGLLIAGFMAGMLWPSHYAALLNPSVKEIQKLALRTNALHSPLYTSGVIFLHNLLAAIVVMVLTGLLTAGIYPAWGLWMNGLTMGYVVSVTGAHLHVSPWTVFAFGMLPHGVFELPAFVWSAVLGMRLGYALVFSLWRRLGASLSKVSGASLRSGQKQVVRVPERTVRYELSRVLRQLPYVIGLLVVAAAIEGTVTPRVLHLLLH